jgi:hypothetical protein
MGNDNHVVVSYKRCGFQGRVGGRVVMIKEPVVVAPKFPSFSSHIFSQASWNISGKVRLDCSVRRNKFMVNNPLHVGKKNNEHALCWTPDLLHLFCSLWLWTLPLRQLFFFFWIITVKSLSNPIMILEILVKVQSSLAFSHSSRHIFTHCCFQSFVKSWGTNFTAMLHMFIFSVKISWQTP